MADSRRQPLKKGDFIGQKYEVFDVLGEGGFGIVYLVYAHGVESAFALKTVRDEYIEDIKIRERFKREAQVWIDIEQHPYLVMAYYVNEISDRFYIVMEHIASDEPEMNTLEGYLKYRPPDLTQSLVWAIQFCYGMEHAYSKGVKAHRDIKPANIMIDQRKTVKITDFGLAGVLVDSALSEGSRVPGTAGAPASMQTAIDESIGTPEYMAPEQFENLSACNERSDIYSFGIVLYQMASGGKLPFSTNKPNYRWSALKHFHQERPIPKLNSPLFSIIQRCLEKEPRKRYQTFNKLRADIESILKRETGKIVSPPELKVLEVCNLALKGASLSSLGKYKEAIVCFNKVLEIDPRDAETWNNKGDALGTLGKYKEAIECYDTALKLNPKFARAWSNKGYALGKVDKYQEAIACYNKALEISPIDLNVWRNKGYYLGRVGEHQEAIACFDKVLELNRTDATTWYFKGLALGKVDKYQEAIVCFDEALAINPRFADAWHIKGILLGVDAPQEAIVCFDKALEIDPRHISAWYNKAEAEDRLGLMQTAARSYQKIIDLNPAQYADKIAYARQRLKELEGKR